MTSLERGEKGGGEQVRDEERVYECVWLFPRKRDGNKLGAISLIFQIRVND